MKKYLIFIITLFIQHYCTFSQDYPDYEHNYNLDNIAFQSPILHDLPASILEDSVINFRNNSSPLKWYTMFENIPGDWVKAWNVTINKERIPTILGITALTAATIATDRPVWEYANRFYHSSTTTKDASKFFVFLGDGQAQFGISAGFAIYGFTADDGRALRTASQVTEVILSCGAVIQVLKHVTGRESPLVSTKRNGRWKFFPNQITYHKLVPHYDAFPSGHIATSLATLTVVLENYPEWKPWLQPIGYSIVTAIGVSLVNTGIHWWSDFPLGLYLGYHFAQIVSHPDSPSGNESNNGSTTHLTFMPSLSPWGNGLTCSYQF